MKLVFPKKLNPALSVLLIFIICWGLSILIHFLVKQNELSNQKKHHSFSSHRCENESPDFIFQTNSFSDVPKDLKQIAYIREFFDSSIWHDIQNIESRLSLQGSLYRLAFEHQLNAEDFVLENILKTPGEIVFWSGDHGRLEDFIVKIPFDFWSLFIFDFFKIAKKDSQLFLTSSKTIGNIDFRFFEFVYSQDRSLYFINFGKTFFVTNQPKCLDIIQQKPEESLVKKHNSSHHLFFSFSYLSGGYAALIDAVIGIGGYYQNDRWQGYGKINHPHFQLPERELWATVPHDAALCVQLPAKMTEVYSLLKPYLKITEIDFFKQVNQTQNFLVCWLKDADYVEPIFLTKNIEALNLQTLNKIFESFVRGSKSVHHISVGGDVQILQKKVVVKERDYLVTLAQTPTYTVFSPHHKNVELFLAVMKKDFPSLKDVLPVHHDHVALVYQPKYFNQFLNDHLVKILKKTQPQLLAPLFNRFLPYTNYLATHKKNMMLKWSAVQEDGVVPLLFEEY